MKDHVENIIKMFSKGALLGIPTFLFKDCDLSIWVLAFVISLVFVSLLHLKLLIRKTKMLITNWYW